MAENIEQPEPNTPPEAPPARETSTPDRRWRFLRRPKWYCALPALPFLGACIGVLALLVLFHWPRINVLVYYFTMRPAFLWFGGLAPFLAIGVVGVRTRWFIVGVAWWLIGLMACGDVLQVLRPFPGRAQHRFEASRMAFNSFTAGGGTPAEVPLRVVSWNVKGGRMGAEGAADQLAAMDPDIVLFQEYSWAAIKLMQTALKKHPHFARYHEQQSGGFAILSRFPVVALSREPLEHYRGRVWRVDVSPGQAVICINAHLPRTYLRTQFIRGASPATLRQVIADERPDTENLAANVSKMTASRTPVIVAGDFNRPPQHAGVRRAMRGLKDAFGSRGFGWGRTAPANHKKVPFPIIRIDRIYVPKDARVFRAEAAPSAFSDHYPVVADISVPTRMALSDKPEM